MDLTQKAHNARAFLKGAGGSGVANRKGGVKLKTKRKEDQPISEDQRT
jgi:hypothetical protein